MGVKEIFNMKDGIKDMRRALTPEEVLPDMSSMSKKKVLMSPAKSLV